MFCGWLRAIVINLSRHLSSVHKVDPKSEEFECLKARAVKMDRRKPNKLKSHAFAKKENKKSLTLVLNNKELIESD